MKSFFQKRITNKRENVFGRIGPPVAVSIYAKKISATLHLSLPLYIVTCDGPLLLFFCRPYGPEKKKEADGVRLSVVHHRAVSHEQTEENRRKGSLHIATSRRLFLCPFFYIYFNL